MMNKNNEEIDFDKEVYTHGNGGQVCSICNYTIPKELQRHRYYNKSYNSTSTHTICGICLIMMAKKINKKIVKKIVEERFIEKL